MRWRRQSTLEHSKGSADSTLATFCARWSSPWGCCDGSNADASITGILHRTHNHHRFRSRFLAARNDRRSVGAFYFVWTVKCHLTRIKSRTKRIVVPGTLRNFPMTATQRRLVFNAKIFAESALDDLGFTVELDPQSSPTPRQVSNTILRLRSIVQALEAL